MNSAIYTIFLPDLHVEIVSCRDNVMWTGVDQAWDKLRTKTHLGSNINLTKFLTPFLGDLWFKDFSNEWLKWWNWTWKSSRSLSIQMIQIVLYYPQSRRIYFEKVFVLPLWLDSKSLLFYIVVIHTFQNHIAWKLINSSPLEVTTTIFLAEIGKEKNESHFHKRG